MSLISFIDSSQHRFVDPEAHCGSDQGQGQITNNTKHNDIKIDDEQVGDDLPDERYVSDSQETHQDRATHNATVSGVLPVQQGVHLVRTQPHLDILTAEDLRDK